MVSLTPAGPMQTLCPRMIPGQYAGVATGGPRTSVRYFFLIVMPRSSCCGAAELNLTGIHEDVDLISGLTQWVDELALL